MGIEDRGLRTFSDYLIRNDRETLQLKLTHPFNASMTMF